MTTFGILSEVWCTGGVERQVISLLKHLPPHLQCVGIGLSPGAPTDVETVQETLRYCPVYGTKRFSDTGRDDPLYVKRFDTYREVQDRFGHCDALLIWSDTQVPDWFRGRVVAVSHGCVDWTKRILALHDGRITDRVAVSRLAARSFPLHRQQEVRVIHNGVEFDRLAPVESWREARFRLGLGEDETVVGFVGRFSEEKDPLAAARAVRGLRKHGVDAVACYCGAGFDKGETQRQVQEITDGHALFLPLNDVVTAYTISNAIVCCSPLEGFGLTRLEALACGVPLVCTRTGIIPEIEEQIGECCEIVRDPHNEGELVWAVLQSQQNPDRSGRARGYVWETFSARKMASGWSLLLESLSGEVLGTEDREHRPRVPVRGRG